MNINELDDIKKHLGYEELKIDEINHILKFSLIWMIVEKEIYSNNANISKSECIAEQLCDTINESKLNHAFLYFKDRYIVYGDTNDSFGSFKFNKNDNKSGVESILKQTEPSKKDKISSLLRIIFRLRNNLFHGEKVDILYGQNKNFQKVNKFLMHLLKLENKHKLFSYDNP